jgi:hypothetical protein
MFVLYENWLASLAAIGALINLKIRVHIDPEEERNNVDQNSAYSR